MEHTVIERFRKERKKRLEVLMTPQDEAAARIEIESIILPQLEKQLRWNPTSTMYAVTYYSVDKNPDEYTWITHDLDYKRSNGEVRKVKRKVLSVAVELAKSEYGIKAKEIYESGYWIFQFVIKI